MQAPISNQLTFQGQNSTHQQISHSLGRIVGNTDISTRVPETSVLPVIRPLPAIHSYLMVVMAAFSCSWASFKRDLGTS
jgi:hypothetical protein